jgi:hypothetical protein
VAELETLLVTDWMAREAGINDASHRGRGNNCKEEMAHPRKRSAQVVANVKEKLAPAGR